MNSPSQIISRIFHIFVSVLLLCAVSQLFQLQFSIRAQEVEKEAPDVMVYTPGHSPEDRLKQNKVAVESADRSNDSGLTPPANDNFANATGGIGNGSSGFLTTTNVEATGEAGEPS